MAKKRVTKKAAKKKTATRKKASPKTSKKKTAKKAAKSPRSPKAAPPEAETAARLQPITAYEEELRTPKSPLSEEELSEFRQLLLFKRAELVGDVENLTNEALRRDDNSGAGNLSSMPIHMADMGTDNWEQEFAIDLIANERLMLREIDAALMRIDEGTYGVCEATHKSIRKKRLRAKPWARYCIEYARKKEQGLVP